MPNEDITLGTNAMPILVAGNVIECANISGTPFLLRLVLTALDEQHH